jgi:hypothetical protein
MQINTFERILSKSESSILDFKYRMYDFNDDKDFVKTSKFVKDVISFSNTVRNETSYIIIGVREEENGTKVYEGLDNFIDDAILQDKIKDKVYPRPHFKFSTFDYDSKRYGIIEFPVMKYPAPITPTMKIKGLEIGKVYYRHGTTNSEASGLEVIRISDWLRSLEDRKPVTDINGDITSLLKQLTKQETKLSVIISEILDFSKRFTVNTLKEFCISEIKGISAASIDNNPDEFKYRIQKVLISLDKMEVNPYSFVKLTPSMVKKELENEEHCLDYKILFNQPISYIENMIEKLDKESIAFGSFQMSSKRFLPDKKEKPVNVYVFADTYKDIYQSIRQKLIDKLIEL